MIRGLISLTETGGNWKRHAACATGVDPDVFHAGERHPQAIVEAQGVCGRCPVRPQCLTAAYEEGDDWAVRGGLTNRQRRAVLRKNGGNVARAVAEATDDVALLLRHIYQQHTRRAGGHVLWTDTRHFINVRNKPYTIHQLAWNAIYGTPPVGHVQRMCDQEECVGKACLTDRRMRETTRQVAA